MNSSFRLHEKSKNSRLVDYDGDSSDDDEKNGSSKSLRDEREIAKSSNNTPTVAGSSTKSIKTSGNGYSHSPEISRPPPIQNGNGHHSVTNGINASNGVGSGSSSGCSSRGSSPRDTSPKNGTSVNGKVEQHSNGSPSMNRANDKWYHNKTRSDLPEQKVNTKASMNRGWQVCKDSSSPSSAAPVNGWSVSDNVP